MGGKIHADVTTTLGHVGNLPFSGNLSERIKSFKKPKKEKVVEQALAAPEVPATPEALAASEVPAPEPVTT
jgi:hypothetical protein